MRKSVLLILLVVLSGAKGMGCNQIPRDEYPERYTCYRWNNEGMTPCPSGEPGLQSGSQPPSEAP